MRLKSRFFKEEQNDPAVAKRNKQAAFPSPCPGRRERDSHGHTGGLPGRTRLRQRRLRDCLESRLRMQGLKFDDGPRTPRSTMEGFQELGSRVRGRCAESQEVPGRDGLESQSPVMTVTFWVHGCDTRVYSLKQVPGLKVEMNY